LLSVRRLIVKNKTTLGIVAAMAAAMLPEHMVYTLEGGHVGIGQRPDTEPVEAKPNKFALEAIEKAKKKRAMRNAKRLKHRNT
jgi:hypothetical protein